MQNNCDSAKLPKQVRYIGPTRRSVSGFYAFRGMDAIEFESTLERDFLIRNEFFPSVLGIVPQPIKIEFIGRNGRTYSYTPDFLVHYRLETRSFEDYPKPLLVEVKPKELWKKHWREWMPKWKAAYRYAKKEGWEFRIYDEDRIRDTVYKNIKFLERYKQMRFPTEESKAILEAVEQMGSTPVHYLLARYFVGIYRAEGIAHIWHLLATRQLDCDVSIPLTEFTQLWIPTND